MKIILLMPTLTLLTCFLFGNASAQDKPQLVRLAKLVIDPAQLESYQAMLKEGIDIFFATKTRNENQLYSRLDAV